MTGTDQATGSRVGSADGVEIAYWSSGSGSPLVLVHGTTADHTTAWTALQPHLEPYVTVHAMDRRGRGASGDAVDYAPRREFEDVAAVVDAVAADTGEKVDVLGHSFGGLCAFGASSLTANIGRLMLYEGWPPATDDLLHLPPGAVHRLEDLVAEGDGDAVVETFLREVAGVPQEQIEGFRAQPTWRNRVASFRTIPRELRAFSDARFDAKVAATLGAPTLLLVGSDGHGWNEQEAAVVAAALPRARVRVLDGQAHVAHLVAPQWLAEVVLDFLAAA